MTKVPTSGGRPACARERPGSKICWSDARGQPPAPRQPTCGRSSCGCALGVAALLVPRPAVNAQQLADKKVARLGVLSTGPVAARQRAFDAFKERLRDLGWIEGRNLIIELRWAEGPADRFRQLAAELDGLNPDLVVAFGGPAALAAKEILS